MLPSTDRRPLLLVVPRDAEASTTLETEVPTDGEDLFTRVNRDALVEAMKRIQGRTERALTLVNISRREPLMSAS